MPAISSGRLESDERWAGTGLRSLLGTWFGGAAGIAVARVRPHPLFPEEEALMARSVAKRREEFSTGRWCAREALREMGVQPCAILTGALREPLWPPGITGSITHAGDICAVVVVRAAEAAGIGIDLVEERQAAGLLRDAAPFVASQAEVAAAHAALPDDANPTIVLFSAKESALKALSGTLGRFVDLTEIRIEFLGSNAYRASLAGASPPVSGWWHRSGGFCVTGASRTLTVTGPIIAG